MSEFDGEATACFVNSGSPSGMACEMLSLQHVYGALFNLRSALGGFRFRFRSGKQDEILCSSSC